MKYTFKQFQAEYPDDAACLEKIMERRYGGTSIVCPACKKPSKFHPMTKRRAYACQLCGHHIYPCVGTPFEKSRTKLTNWFFAMYLMTSTRHGVAAKELERQIGCTYKTAWRMAHELRKLMAQSDDHEPLDGHVEVDETFLGGKQKNARYNPTNKTIVMGMLQRDGIVRAGPIDDTSRYSLEPVIHRNIIRGSTISTDSWRAYADLKASGYKHGTVNHSIKQWVKGIHHVNNLEAFWAQLKRSICGTHIHVSRKHAWKYVAEFSYRYNMRKAPAFMFHQMISSLSRPRLADS